MVASTYNAPAVAASTYSAPVVAAGTVNRIVYRILETSCLPARKYGKESQEKEDKK